MKLPWMMSPTSLGSGIERPMPKPSMARPRMTPIAMGYPHHPWYPLHQFGQREKRDASATVRRNTTRNYSATVSVGVHAPTKNSFEFPPSRTTILSKCSVSNNN